MESTITREDDGTIVLNITIPLSLVKKTTEETIEETVKVANVPGFRKGKAPKKIVSDRVDKEKIKEEVLKKLLPLAYAEAVKNHEIKPIINPRIHVEELSDDKDWIFTASTCEAPVVDLNGYKESIKKITAKGKIILPGKEEAQGPDFNEILKELEKSTTIKISKIIVEQEVERLLAQTLDEIKRLGLTLDQYLASTKRSIEDLKKEYEVKAMNDIKLEFALSKIAEEE
ncbi:MAG: trigger factor, partial [Patescibacteria group bacterium]